MTKYDIERICDAYEQGYGKGLNGRECRSIYPPMSDEFMA